MTDTFTTIVCAGIIAAFIAFVSTGLYLCIRMYHEEQMEYLRDYHEREQEYAESEFRDNEQTPIAETFEPVHHDDESLYERELEEKKREWL